MTADVAVVVAALPELGFLQSLQDGGGALLEDLEEGGQGVLGGLIGEEVDVLGHEDVGDDKQTSLGASLFEDAFEGVFCFRGGEEGFAAVAAEGDEVELAGVVDRLRPVGMVV